MDDGTQPDWEFFTIAVTMTTVAGVFVILRLGARLYTTYSLAWKDYFLAIAMEGLGIHNRLLSAEQLQAPYKMGIGFTKISILTLYYRVFVNKTFRQVVIVLMVYVSLYTVATTVATILQCIPIKRAWDRTVPGTCVQPTAQWYSYAALNMTAEVIMFFLPMPMLKRLHVPRQQKVDLFLIFAVGLFIGSVIFCSVMRLVTIGIEKKQDDTNYAWRGGNHWTTVELNTGFICASIPALKAPLSALLRKLGLRSGGASGYNPSTADQRYEFGSKKAKKSIFSHALASRRNNSQHHDDDSEQHIVAASGWPLSDITKTTTNCLFVLAANGVAFPVDVSTIPHRWLGEGYTHQHQWLEHIQELPDL
uniref:Rhodopsin domain-containing protein n=1 Tax=Talaromyces marneffei PM1 TaxID=1077442 RepID=A0A093VQP1_TALMA